MAAAIGPAVAGTWYPADPGALATQVQRLLGGGGEPGTSGAVTAVIAPHAGYVYSGSVAGQGFGPLRGTSVDRVILLGPSHYAAYRGAAIPAAAAYRTPLGEVALDDEARAALGGAAPFRIDDGPFAREHSLEAELPFLQLCLEAGWRLLPVLVGAGPQGDAASAVAAGLQPLLGARTLVVVSSDFTHFGPHFDYVPFSDDVPARIERLDTGAIERILAWDAPGFADYVRRTGATICGRNAIDVLLRLGGGGHQGALARYDTSGRITGDWTHSVSYAALVFRRRGAEPAWRG